MKQIIALALLLFISIPATFAQKDKKRASAHETVKNNLMSVTYGRPSKKGREIFADKGLVPFGQVWRTGADEATEVKLNKGCMFAGRQVNAGTYTLFTVPGTKEWRIILNKKLGQWGAYDYEKVKDDNVLDGVAEVSKLDKPIETFTIELKEDGMYLKWDTTQVFIPVKPFN